MAALYRGAQTAHAQLKECAPRAPDPPAGAPRAPVGAAGRAVTGAAVAQRPADGAVQWDVCY